MAGWTGMDQRYGLPVTDPAGGRWLVRWYRAAAADTPDPTAAPAALPDLLDPRRSRALPRTGPPPAASWVMGRSARWQGPDAVTTEDPVREHALRLRYGLASAAGMPSLVDLLVLVWRSLGIRGALATDRHERTWPWAVELVARDDPRSVLWHVSGPDAAEPAGRAVLTAVAAGTVPAPPGAVLMALRNPPSAAAG